MAAVIFIDLVGSSKARDGRAGLQRALISLRDSLNDRFRDRLAAPFTVVWGDELKGVLQDPRPAWDVYRAAHGSMDGIPFYFSVGLGTIDTAIGYEAEQDIDLLDGSAFKAARGAMDRLKRQGERPYRVEFASAGNAHLAEALNAYVAILNDLVQHMTAAQRKRFVHEFPWNGRASTDGMADKEEVSRQSAWETLQRARIDAYRAANRGIEALLQLAFEHQALVLPSGKEPHP